ncbi:hypothetical protein DIEEDFHO_00022 [Enterococcus phage vB_OCPT_Bill]|uniref:Uncharacterized protein n=1 Tax=Enterococcus phage vB_OCPT_Bill TaxID=2922322 RepID=A0AAE9GA30_9CAUD|nr:hypothetical protein DIEEDFHO_00022 [Enterococcus phage vB_OCPT_Bill]
MLDIFYNIWGGFASHPVLIILSIIGIYVLGYILFIGNVVLFDDSNVKRFLTSFALITVLSTLFDIYSLVVKIYVFLVIISGLVVLFT